MSKENENNDVVENEDGEQEQEETLFDAVSAAIDAETVGLEADGESPDESDNETEETGDGDDSESEEDGGSEKSGSKASESEGSEDAGSKKSGSEDEGEEGSESTGGTETEVPDGSGDGEESGSADAGDRQLDPVNDPIPDGLKESTRERIQTLIGRAKDGEEAAAERDDFVGMVTSTGADAEQFSATLGWLTLYNSDKIDDRRKALVIMQQATAGLANEIGEPLSGADALSEFNDLQAEVEEGTLSQERAEEIAASRKRKAADEAAQQTENEQGEQQRRAATAVAQGKSDLNALEVALKASDPRYLEKKAVLVPALQEMMRTIHPSQWKTTFQTAYDKLVLPEKPATPKPPAKDTETETDDSHEPLRPKQPAGKGEKTPSTMGQAIDAALEEMSN